MVSQNAIPSRKYLGGYQPYVFTEQGVAMLATVLNSERTIEKNRLYCQGTQCKVIGLFATGREHPCIVICRYRLLRRGRN